MQDHNSHTGFDVDVKFVPVNSAHIATVPRHFSNKLQLCMPIPERFKLSFILRKGPACGPMLDKVQFSANVT